ncbi:MAG: hypothetical protein IJU84_01985 [Clostridia bacterium]|nr:hypothetical protein [Clostridia bacterium]
MKKNMYSLILSEDVVKEIDRLAYENGTNRSNFINGILAEYCRMVTPEMRIKNIFDRALELFEGSRFLPSKEPNSGIMTLRTSLEYKYHPTVKYDVQLFRRRGYAFGQLRVGLRSQSPELLRVLGDFFELYATCEGKYSPLTEARRGVFSFDGSKFIRTLVLPEAREYDASDLADAINLYVVSLDDMLNNFFTGKYSTALDFEMDYVRHLERMPLQI